MSQAATGDPVKQGSQYWIRNIVNDDVLRQRFEGMIGASGLDWFSPLAKDQYKEYQLCSRDVYDRLHMSSRFSYEEWRKQFSFWAGWPRRQPVWDGLAVDPDVNAAGRTFYIVEAKARISEMKGTKMTASDPESRRRITEAMYEVYNIYYGHKGDFDKWTNGCYQLANRLTFLHKMNSKRCMFGFQTKLVLLNICNAGYGRTSDRQWRDYYKRVWPMMIGTDHEPDNVLVINFDVR